MPLVNARLRRACAFLCVLTGVVLLGACGSQVAGTANRAPGGGTAGTNSAPTGVTTPTGITTPTGTGAEDGNGSPTTTGGASSRAPAPAGLEKFYGQQLAWGGCSDFAIDDTTKKQYADPKYQCAFLTVPLDYAAPSGPTVEVGVLKVASTGSDRIGSVIVNPGGPGVSGMSTAAALAEPDATTGQPAQAAALLQRFDLVGFDPRGVGASQPAIRCQTDAERDADRAIVDRTRTAAEIAAADERTRKRAAGCVAMSTANGVDGAAFLGHIGTVDVAKDLDVLRAAVGDDQLTYIGWSYGTSIGTQYAEQFPTGVRAMVLDGAVDPDADPVQKDIDQAAGFQTAFDNFAKWCATQAGCVLGTDPSKATAVYQSLTRPLLDTPLQLKDGRVLSYDDAVTGTIMPLYSDQLWPYLLQGLQGLSKGDGSILMVLADSYYERDRSGHYTNVMDALVGVNCMDAPRPDAAASLKRAQEYAKAAPFMDNGDPAAALKSICDFWPAAPTMAPHVPQVDGLATPLVFSTRNDPATPYQAGVNLAKYLGGVLVTVEGTRHTAYLGAGIDCVDQIGNAYLIDLTLPADGTTCS
jgi:pimeloyl-ACP methyl ester carboxylesterase